MGYVSKNVSYDELTLEEFVAGYSPILLLPQVSSHERKHRTEHLGALMYLASIYEWPAVCSLHEAVLSEIEKGRLNWEDSFLHLENRTLTGLHKKTKDQKRPAPSSSNAVLFNRDYQKGSCSHSKDHYAMLKGEKKWLCHICAACWVKDKAKRMHSEYADDCPNKPKEWLDNTTCIPLIQDFIVAGSQDINRNLFQDNCVVSRTSAQAFAFIRTIRNFTGPLFRNFVIQFIIKTFPRQLFKILLRLS